MLYNPVWDKPQPKPATWASVIAWLETKDPDEYYSYKNREHCLAAQYNQAMGRKYDTSVALSSNIFTYFRFDRRLERLARSNWSRTFGEALSMAKHG